MTTPSIPKGTRDFGPAQMARRNFVFDTIRRQFTLYGFQPLETPAMEQLSVLTGKYGEEGDRLIYKILNSGNYLEGITGDDLATGAAALAPRLAERALRYDLTVPFARYVAMNKGQLTLPFRRYQMQPVWRADRPQRGRYREFWQCDADVVGTGSLVCEAELLALVWSVFQHLGLSSVVIKINSRKLLTAMAGRLGAPDKVLDFCQAIDKLDKIGRGGVEKELAERGFSPEAIITVGPVLEVKPEGFAQLEAIATWLGESQDALAGRHELEQIREMALQLGVPPRALEFDPTLARGLNYYTGCIIEVKALDVAIGSIAGGGRYDDLTGVFGLSGVSGVGVSFGIDRICDVLEERALFPSIKATQARVLVCWMEPAQRPAALQLLARLRTRGVPAEIYPDSAKIGKQIGYADKLGIPFVAILGPDDVAAGQVMLRDLGHSTQKPIPLEAMADYMASIN